MNQCCDDRLSPSGCWLHLWFCRVLFVARGPWASADARPSLRPLINEGGTTQHNSGTMRRENVAACLEEAAGCLTCESRKDVAPVFARRVRAGHATPFDLARLRHAVPEGRSVVPQEGLEPPTPSLRMTCSTN